MENETPSDGFVKGVLTTIRLRSRPCANSRESGSSDTYVSSHCNRLQRGRAGACRGVPSASSDDENASYFT